MRKDKIKIGQYILFFVLLALSIICILPVVLVLIASFTDASALIMEGFSFFPSKWSLAGWQ